MANFRAVAAADLGQQRTPSKQLQEKPMGPVASDGSTRGKSKESVKSSTSTSSRKSFTERQEDLLLKQGRANATRHARVSAAMASIEGAGDGASVACSVVSKAPSLHPSVGQSSVGLSEATVGAGDDTGYWDYQHRHVERKDLGHKCHECKEPFRRLGDALTERRGGRISMRYHAECFSGYADPRSQARSSHHEGHLAGSQLHAAPTDRTTKMRTSSHFEGSSRTLRGGTTSASSVGGKFGAQFSMGHNSFGAQSSKGKVPQRAPGGFTEAELAAHDRLVSISENEETQDVQD